MMRRRDLIPLLGGVVAAWPLTVRAQQASGNRRVGMLVAINDPDMKAFRQELDRRGWKEGQGIQIDFRYAPAGEKLQSLAKELIALRPDVIFAMSRPAAAALQKETRTIPIVFNNVIDPIGAGFIANFTRPGGNLTGLMAYEPSVVGKWLQMLKAIAPQTKSVALLGNPKTAPYYDYLLHAAEAAAAALGIVAVPSRIVNDAADIERAIAAIASMPNSAVIKMPESTANAHADLIIRLTARHRLPAVYTHKFQTRAGGLMSYGIVSADHYRQAAYYVDRILRGAKTAELPVQTPTRYETVLNLKTAKALGLNAPAGLLVAADEVIE